MLSHYLDKNHTFEQRIDLILELKSPLKVKPKGRPPGTKNKKHFQIEAGLDNFTRYELSKFEYKEEKDKSKNTLIKKLDLSKRQRKD